MIRSNKNYDTVQDRVGLFLGYECYHLNMKSHKSNKLEVIGIFCSKLDLFLFFFKDHNASSTCHKKDNALHIKF